MFTAQVMGARTWKNPCLALLAANTAVSMTQCDGFLSTKLFNEYYGQFNHRISTVIGGMAPNFCRGKPSCGYNMLTCAWYP